MSHKITKILSLLLCFFLIFEQSGFAQVAGQLDISGHMLQLRNALTQDKFRPTHLRYLSYDNSNNNLNILLDKGNLDNLKNKDIESSTKTLLKYFLIGVTLPDDVFWVNLRPDSPDNVLDDSLAATDIGKIFLEADLQLKKDTARFTSPETAEGKEYWEKLYKKAEEVLGSGDVSIPTLTRPWVVPDEVIISETDNNAYIYKATLKVLLEQDYLKNSTAYNFTDERLKAINEYSSELIRELIIPKLNKEINTAKRYAPLRQVYYSLILARWFKDRFYGKSGLYPWLINQKNLTGLTSTESWSKETYFRDYQKSFKDGEYNFKVPTATIYGQTIRSYFSGGFAFGATELPMAPKPAATGEFSVNGPVSCTLRKPGEIQADRAYLASAVASNADANNLLGSVKAGEAPGMVGGATGGAGAEKKERESAVSASARGLKENDFVKVVFKNGITFSGVFEALHESGGYVSVLAPFETVIGRIYLNKLKKIEKLSTEDLNRWSPFTSLALFSHGTNAFAVLQAIRFTNKQLRPSDDLPYPPMTGESLGSTALNRQFVSTISLGSSSSTLGWAWRYAEGTSSEGGFLTRDNVDKKIEEVKKSEGTPAEEKERRIDILRRAKEALLGMSKAEYDAYLELSRTPALIIGDGVYAGSVRSDIPNEQVFKRVNIRIIVVKDKATADYINSLMAEEGVNDIMVMDLQTADRAVEEHRAKAFSEGEFSETPLTKAIREKSSISSEQAPRVIGAAPGIVGGATGATVEIVRDLAKEETAIKKVQKQVGELGGVELFRKPFDEVAKSLGAIEIAKDEETGRLYAESYDIPALMYISADEWESIKKERKQNAFRAPELQPRPWINSPKIKGPGIYYCKAAIEREEKSGYKFDAVALYHEMLERAFLEEGAVDKFATMPHGHANLRAVEETLRLAFAIGKESYDNNRLALVRGMELVIKYARQLGFKEELIKEFSEQYTEALNSVGSGQVAAPGIVGGATGRAAARPSVGISFVDGYIQDAEAILKIQGISPEEALSEAAKQIVVAFEYMPEPEAIVNIQTALNILKDAAAKKLVPGLVPLIAIIEKYAKPDVKDRAGLYNEIRDYFTAKAKGEAPPAPVVSAAPEATPREAVDLIGLAKESIDTYSPQELKENATLKDQIAQELKVLLIDPIAADDREKESKEKVRESLRAHPEYLEDIFRDYLDSEFVFEYETKRTHLATQFGAKDQARVDNELRNYIKNNIYAAAALISGERMGVDINNTLLSIRKYFYRYFGNFDNEPFANQEISPAQIIFSKDGKDIDKAGPSSGDMVITGILSHYSLENKRPVLYVTAVYKGRKVVFYQDVSRGTWRRIEAISQGIVSEAKAETALDLNTQLAEALDQVIAEHQADMQVIGKIQAGQEKPSAKDIEEHVSALQRKLTDAGAFSPVRLQSRMANMGMWRYMGVPLRPEEKDAKFKELLEVLKSKGPQQKAETKQITPVPALRQDAGALVEKNIAKIFSGEIEKINAGETSSDISLLLDERGEIIAFAKDAKKFGDIADELKQGRRFVVTINANTPVDGIYITKLVKGEETLSPAAKKGLEVSLEEVNKISNRNIEASKKLTIEEKRLLKATIVQMRSKAENLDTQAELVLKGDFDMFLDAISPAIAGEFMESLKDVTKQGRLVKAQSMLKADAAVINGLTEKIGVLNELADISFKGKLDIELPEAPQKPVTKVIDPKAKPEDKQLTRYFVGNLWVKAGKFWYRIWAENEKANFQRYNETKAIKAGKAYTFALNESFKVGSDHANNYVMDEDVSGLSSTHFIVQVAKDENAYKFTLIDANSETGTTIEYTPPAITERAAAKREAEAPGMVGGAAGAVSAAGEGLGFPTTTLEFRRSILNRDRVVKMNKIQLSNLLEKEGLGKIDPDNKELGRLAERIAIAQLSADRREVVNSIGLDIDIPGIVPLSFSALGMAGSPSLETGAKDSAGGMGWIVMAPEIRLAGGRETRDKFLKEDQMRESIYRFARESTTDQIAGIIRKCTGNTSISGEDLNKLISVSYIDEGANKEVFKISFGTNRGTPPLDIIIAAKSEKNGAPAPISRNMEILEELNGRAGAPRVGGRFKTVDGRDAYFVEFIPGETLGDIEIRDHTQILNNADMAAEANFEVYDELKGRASTDINRGNFIAQAGKARPIDFDWTLPQTFPELFARIYTYYFRFAGVDRLINDLIKHYGEQKATQLLKEVSAALEEHLQKKNAQLEDEIREGWLGGAYYEAYEHPEYIFYILSIDALFSDLQYGVRDYLERLTRSPTEAVTAAGAPGIVGGATGGAEWQKARIKDAETTLKTPGLSGEDYRRAAEDLGMVALNQPHLMQPSTVQALGNLLRIPGFDADKPYGPAASALGNTAIKNPDLATQAMQALETCLKTPGLSSYAYAPSSMLLSYIARMNPGLASQAEQTLETIMRTPYLNRDVYEYTVQALGDIVRTNPELAPQILQALATVLKTSGLDHNTYRSAAAVLDDTAQRNPELIQPSTVQALETFLSAPRLLPDTYRSAATALQTIAINKPKLIQASTLQVLGIPLRSSEPNLNASFAATVLVTIAQKQPELANQTVQVLETALRIPGLYPNGYGATALALDIIAQSNPELIQPSTVQALETILRTPGLEDSHAYGSAASAFLSVAEKRPELTAKSEFTKICQICRGTEKDTLIAIGELSGLIQKFPSAWSNFIKPIIYNQTVGAFLCLREIAGLYFLGAIESEADLELLKEIIEKQGVRAYDILANFLVQGVRDDIIAKPISKEKEQLLSFLNNNSYVILEVYRAVKADPLRRDELIARCKSIHKSIISGDATGVENDKLFSAVLYYVFPPAVTMQRQQYDNLYRKRPDRPRDTQAIPVSLQGREFEVSTGQYILKDSAKPLDEAAWNTILEAVRKINKETNIVMTPEEISALGKDLLTYWQTSALYNNRRDLLERLYRYYRHSRGATLPDTLGSIQDIMAHKEFIGDTLRDIINSCISEYAKGNPKEYRDITQQMFKTRIENPRAMAQPILGVLNRFKNDPVQAKEKLSSILRIQDEVVIERIWQQLKDKNAPQEIESVLRDIAFQVQPGKEAVLISGQLQGQEYAAMQGEVSAKYEFSEGKDKMGLRFITSKRKAHGVAGLNMGVCVATDEKLWDNPNFMNVIILDNNDIAWGGMHVLIIKENGKRYLSLPGINPHPALLAKVNADDIYNKLIAYAQELAKALNCQAVLIPKDSSIHSNRSEIQRIIAARNYKTLPLEKIHEFSYSPFEYSFQDCFVAATPSQAAVEKPGIIAGATGAVGEAPSAVQYDFDKPYFDAALFEVAKNMLAQKSQAAVEKGRATIVYHGDLDGVMSALILAQYLDQQALAAGKTIQLEFKILNTTDKDLAKKLTDTNGQIAPVVFFVDQATPYADKSGALEDLAKQTEVLVIDHHFNKDFNTVNSRLNNSVITPEQGLKSPIAGNLYPASKLMADLALPAITDSAVRDKIKLMSQLGTLTDIRDYEKWFSREQTQELLEVANQLDAIASTGRVDTVGQAQESNELLKTLLSQVNSLNDITSNPRIQELAAELNIDADIERIFAASRNDPLIVSNLAETGLILNPQYDTSTVIANQLTQRQEYDRKGYNREVGDRMVVMFKLLANGRLSVSVRYDGPLSQKGKLGKQGIDIGKMMQELFGGGGNPFAAGVKEGFDLAGRSAGEVAREKLELIRKYFDDFAATPSAVEATVAGIVGGATGAVGAEPGFEDLEKLGVIIAIGEKYAVDLIWSPAREMSRSKVMAETFSSREEAVAKARDIYQKALARQTEIEEEEFERYAKEGLIGKYGDRFVVDARWPRKAERDAAGQFGVYTDRAKALARARQIYKEYQDRQAVKEAQPAVEARPARVLEEVERIAPVRQQPAVSERPEVGSEFGLYGHLINGRQSTSRTKGGKRYLLDWDKDATLRAFYKTILDKYQDILKKGEVPAQMKGNLLWAVFKAIDDTIRYGYTREELRETRDMLLGEAIDLKRGVCKDMGLLAVVVLERMLMDGYLKGKAFFVRGRGHGWALYRTSAGEYFVFDVAQRSFRRTAIGKEGLAKLDDFYQGGGAFGRYRDGEGMDEILRRYPEGKPDEEVSAAEYTIVPGYRPVIGQVAEAKAPAQKEVPARKPRRSWAAAALGFFAGLLMQANVASQEKAPPKEPTPIIQGEFLQEKKETQQPIINQKEVDGLINQLGDDDIFRREEASAKLAAMGMPVVPSLLKAKDTAKDAEVRARSVAVIKKIAQAKYSPVLKALEDPKWQDIVLKTLRDGKLPGIIVNEQLMSSLENLLRAQKDDAASVRAVRESAIELIVESLRRMLQTPQEKYPAIVGAIVKLDRNAVDTLLPLLDLTGPGWEFVRETAISGLGELGADAEKAIPALEKLLKHPDKFTRQSAEGALKNIRRAIEEKKGIKQKTEIPGVIGQAAAPQAPGIVGGATGAAGSRQWETYLQEAETGFSNLYRLVFQGGEAENAATAEKLANELIASCQRISDNNQGLPIAKRAEEIIGTVRTYIMPRIRSLTGLKPKEAAQALEAKDMKALVNELLKAQDEPELRIIEEAIYEKRTNSFGSSPSLQKLEMAEVNRVLLGPALRAASVPAARAIKEILKEQKIAWLIRGPITIEQLKALINSSAERAFTVLKDERKGTHILIITGRGFPHETEQYASFQESAALVAPVLYDLAEARGHSHPRGTDAEPTPGADYDNAKEKDNFVLAIDAQGDMEMYLQRKGLREFEYIRAEADIAKELARIGILKPSSPASAAPGIVGGATGMMGKKPAAALTNVLEGRFRIGNVEYTAEVLSDADNMKQTLDSWFASETGRYFDRSQWESEIKYNTRGGKLFRLQANNGELLGIAYAYVVPFMFADGNIKDVYMGGLMEISEKYRGRGLGTVLIAKIIESSLNDTGIDESARGILAVHPAEDSAYAKEGKRARDFFAQLGFIAVPFPQIDELRDEAEAEKYRYYTITPKAARALLYKVNDTIKKPAPEMYQELLLFPDLTGPVGEAQEAPGIVGGAAGIVPAGAQKKPGGIDFRALPIIRQPLATGAAPVRPMPELIKETVPKSEKEWQEIQGMLDGGIIPSSQRIKEYVEVCSKKGNFEQEMRKVVSCIADILRMEEERASSTEPALKEMLALLESDKSLSDFGVSLRKITVLPQEPLTINEFVTEER